MSKQKRITPLVRKLQTIQFTAKQWNRLTLILDDQCYDRMQPKEKCWDTPGYKDTCHAFCMRNIFLEAGAVLGDEK